MNNERAWDNPEQMIGVDDALERILAHFSPLDAVETPIVDALGMVTARAILANVDVPPFRNSAMDGYALRSVDTASSPATLKVVDTAVAGRPSSRSVEAGESMRIMTGAPLPDGADAVVRFEETDERSRIGSGALHDIRVDRTIRAAENVREAGEDIHAGDVAVPLGTRLSPAQIGILASLNLASVPVHRRPRVAILSTGDEVVEQGPALRPGQIRNSNSYMLAALVRQAGGEPILLGIARDTTADVLARLQAVDEPDVLMTSGGVSVGDYDVVKNVLRSEGQIDIWQVRMKPGKPLAYGTIRGIPLLGLPGNPVAALVAFEQFGRPAVRLMLGRRDVRLAEIDATVTEPLSNPGRRRHYVRANVEYSPRGFEARPTVGQGSAILTGAAHANCFIVVPESCAFVEAGATVRVQLLENAQGW